MGSTPARRLEDTRNEGEKRLKGMSPVVVRKQVRAQMAEGAKSPERKRKSVRQTGLQKKVL